MDEYEPLVTGVVTFEDPGSTKTPVEGAAVTATSDRPGVSEAGRCKLTGSKPCCKRL